jgi:hypothetical protein
MSARCDAESCPHWTGHGCVCEVMDLPRRDCSCSDLGRDEYCDRHGGI